MHTGEARGRLIRNASRETGHLQVKIGTWGSGLRALPSWDASVLPSWTGGSSLRTSAGQLELLLSHGVEKESPDLQATAVHTTTYNTATYGRVTLVV